MSQYCFQSWSNELSLPLDKSIPYLSIRQVKLLWWCRSASYQLVWNCLRLMLLIMNLEYNFMYACHSSEIPHKIMQWVDFLLISYISAKVFWMYTLSAPQNHAHDASITWNTFVLVLINSETMCSVMHNSCHLQDAFRKHLQQSCDLVAVCKS